MDPVASTGARGPVGATNGQSESASAASRGKAAARPPYRSPPAGMGPPTPLPSGPFRPPGAPPGPLPTSTQAPIMTCPQRPIYVNKILELDARNKENVHASEEDKNELRIYIATEQEKVQRATEVINNHEVHIDHQDFELATTRTEMRKCKE
eukprot:7600154-Heterocapsa_arctica.AAC.1